MIIAFAGLKGGSAKSTTSIAVAAELTYRGHSALLVDADAEQATSLTWGGIASENGHPSPTVISMRGAMHRPEQLPKLARSYDHVVIDCPPRLGDISRSALMTADVVVMPCGPSHADFWSLGKTIDIVREAEAFKNFVSVVLIARQASRTTLGRGAREAIGGSGLGVLNTELGYRTTYGACLGSGLGPTRFAPKSTAAVEVRALVDELLQIRSAA